jgi:hypothetical protein
MAREQHRRVRGQRERLLREQQEQRQPERRGRLLQGQRHALVRRRKEQSCYAMVL